MDPLKILSLQEAAWASTVLSLYTEERITFEQVSIFTLTITIWWICWSILSKLAGKKYTNMMLIFWNRIAELRTKQFLAIFLLYFFVSAIFLVTTVILGGGGDGRLAIIKFLRPLEGFVVLLAPIVLFKLIVDKIPYRLVLLLLLTIMMLVSGGKGAILAFLLPITAAQLIGKIELNKNKIVGIGLLLINGILISTVINYGAGSLIDGALIFSYRLMMEGDIYILALANHGLTNVNLTSLISYILGPLLKFFMLPIEFDQHIGSQIASAIAGYEVPTGPNGHWPILLMAYGMRFGMEMFVITLIFFILVILVKLLVLSSNAAKKIPIALVVPVGSFVVQFPQTFFADPPYQFVYLVHVILVSIVLSAIFMYFEINSLRSKSRL